MGDRGIKTSLIIGFNGCHTDSGIGYIDPPV
jgi:hypothetical protein